MKQVMHFFLFLSTIALHPMNKTIESKTTELHKRVSHTNFPDIGELNKEWHDGEPINGVLNEWKVNQQMITQNNQLPEHEILKRRTLLRSCLESETGHVCCCIAGICLWGWYSNHFN